MKLFKADTINNSRSTKMYVIAGENLDDAIARANLSLYKLAGLKQLTQKELKWKSSMLEELNFREISMENFLMIDGQVL